MVSALAGTAAAVGTNFILPLVGFGAAGVKAASAAALAQSVLYPAAVPAGSAFATLTSWGATYVIAGTLAVASVPVGAVVGGGVYMMGRALGY